jgi:hypothetical protein
MPVPARPDLIRLLEQGNFWDRLRELERLARLTETTIGVIHTDPPSHTHSGTEIVKVLADWDRLRLIWLGW